MVDYKSRDKNGGDRNYFCRAAQELLQAYGGNYRIERKRYRQAENERGTYNRLWRIKSLSDYVRPFYDAAQLFGSEAPEIVRIADQIYSVLFCEQIRFASVRQIRLAAEDMLSGCRRHVIERLNPRLYQDLKNKKYLYVWVKRTVSRIRHRAAVYLKYRRSLKNKG